MWKSKRGRKPLRPHYDQLTEGLQSARGFSWHTRQSRAKIQIPALRARMRNTLLRWNRKTEWTPVPEGPLLLVADALMQQVRGEPWTVHFMVVRPVQSSQAIMLPPFLRAGKEHSEGGWTEPLAFLDRSLKARTSALTCDGAVSLVAQAKREGWLVQRCHFHIRSAIANYVRTGIWSWHREEGMQVKELTDLILTHPNQDIAEQAVKELSHLLPTFSSQGLKRVLRGFVRYHADYRTYLLVPELSLPTTTNSMEHLIGEVRNLQRRARGFRTVESLYEWIVAYCKHRQTVTCNGKIQPN